MSRADRRERRKLQRKQKKAAEKDDKMRAFLSELHLRIKALGLHPNRERMLLKSRELMALYMGIPSSIMESGSDK
jgi:hypothetical protein